MSIGAVGYSTDFYRACYSKNSSKNMSQSNISKIQNGKVVPRIETLQKIATATHTRLVISFESMEGDD